jgi:hypothetical protein
MPAWVEWLAIAGAVLLALGMGLTLYAVYCMLHEAWIAYWNRQRLGR